MMAAAREPDQADFDLERFVDMFDEALTSKDERVVNALRSLMMMVILTKSESRHSGLLDRESGPLRRLFEDMHLLNRRLARIEEEVDQSIRRAQKSWPEKEESDWVIKREIAKKSSQMAQQIDQDLLNTIKAKGLYHK